MSDWSIHIDPKDLEAITDIAVGTSARYAYELYNEKRRQIDALEYECRLLIDKYHSEMCNAHIPPQFRQDIINEKKKKNDKDISRLARNHFLKLVFSEDFLKEHQIEFKELMWLGYERTAANVMLDLDGDYYYSVEIPCPQKSIKDETKARLMGQVKFRADRILKSKWDEFVKEWEAVQMPTYDWKKCFEAIEKVVNEENKK